MSTKKWLFGLSIAVAAALVSDLLTGTKILAYCWDAALAVLHFELPVWVVFICLTACLLLAAVLGSVVAFAMREAQEPKQIEPLWQHYKVDKLFGIRWRWNVEKRGKVNNMTPYCPECDMQLSLLNWNCSKCAFQDHPSNRFSWIPGEVPVRRGAWSDDLRALPQNVRDRVCQVITSTVKREVERRMRTGEYKECLKGN